MNQAYVLTLDKGEYASVQWLTDGSFRVKLEYNGDWVYLDMAREQLEKFNTNIHAALLEGRPF